MFSPSVLLTIAGVLLVIAIGLMFVIPYVIRKNSDQPDYERQWTDPKNHG